MKNNSECCIRENISKEEGKSLDKQYKKPGKIKIKSRVMHKRILLSRKYYLSR